MITNRSGRPWSLQLVMMATERQADSFVWNSTKPYKFSLRRTHIRVNLPILGELVTRQSLPKRNSTRKKDKAIAGIQQFPGAGVMFRNVTLSILTLMSKRQEDLEMNGTFVESLQYGLRLHIEFNGNV